MMTDVLKTTLDKFASMQTELESLRQENSRLRAQLEKKESGLKGAVFVNADMQAELKRLREALEKIVAFRLGGVKLHSSHVAEEALNPPKRS